MYFHAYNVYIPPLAHYISPQLMQICYVYSVQKYTNTSVTQQNFQHLTMHTRHKYGIRHHYISLMIDKFIYMAMLAYDKDSLVKLFVSIYYIYTIMGIWKMLTEGYCLYIHIPTA